MPQHTRRSANPGGGVRDALQAHEEIHERLLVDPLRKDPVAQTFSSLLTAFGGVPEFAEFKRLLAETATGFGQNLPYRLDVDFSA